MNQEQQFATDVTAMMPDGAVWYFRTDEEDFARLMPGIGCVQTSVGEWRAVMGRRERPMLLRLLQQQADDGGYLEQFNNHRTYAKVLP